MRHAHAAAGEDVEADELAVFGMGEQAEVLGVDIDAVVVRQSQTDLELPRQVDLAVDRLLFVSGCLGRLAIEPDLVVARLRGARWAAMRLAISCISSRTPRWGAGHDMTLRFTSPHAPRVVSRVSLMPAIVALRSRLRTPWNWMPWRLVKRKVPLAYCWQCRRRRGTGRR